MSIIRQTIVAVATGLFIMVAALSIMVLLPFVLIDEFWKSGREG